MVRPIKVTSLGPCRIWLQYSDGVSGEVDLSDVSGVSIFKAWDDPGCFDKVRIAPHRAIAWDDDIELCPDALYLEITGKSVAEVMPGAQSLPLDA
jgi:hypothetical protein